MVAPPHLLLPRLLLPPLLLLCLLLPTPLLAQKLPEKPDAYLLSANSLMNDDKAGIVTAEGKVELLDGEQLLLTERLFLDKIHNSVRVEGKVATIQKDGSVLFAKNATFDNHFINGFFTEPSVRMVDNSRFIAVDGKRINSRYLLFSHGIYSPCAPCADDPRHAPLWQLRADKVTHDNETHRIMYEDATLDIYGQPVLFVPFFSQTDPTVKRASGFLTPTIGSNNNIGFFVRTPYYFDIAPNLDYTLTPTISANDGLRYKGNIRARFDNGFISLDHSLVVGDRTDESGIVKTDQLRGHLFGNVRFDLDSEFRTGLDIAMQSDKTYLQHYGEGIQDILTNRAYLEQFKGRDYGALELFYFQDNRPGSRPDQPLVLPRLTYAALGEPDQTLGGRWSFDGSALALQRDNNTNTRTLGLDGGWDRRDVLPGGFVSTLHADLRDDFFWVQNLADSQNPALQINAATTNRLLANGQVLVSYPVAEYYHGFSHVIEPMVGLTATPTRSYNPAIPNEDSQSVEFDTTNLFNLNRYSGTDAQEQGVRAAYGFRTGFYGDKAGVAEMMFGQSYRFTDDPLFPAGSGLATQLSDYVGDIKLDPAPWLHANYMFRLDKNFNTLHRQDATLNFGVPEFRPHMEYVFIDTSSSGTITTTTIAPDGSTTTLITNNAIDQMHYGFSSNFTKFWTFNFDQNMNLGGTNRGLLTTTVALVYKDECYDASITFTRDNTVRTDVISGDTIMLHFDLKNLGGLDSKISVP